MGLEGIAALSIASTAISASGSIMQGAQQKDAYDYNANILDIQEQEVEAAGALKIEEMATEEESLLSTQRSMYAKAGVRQTGSPLEVALDTATNAEFDKMVEQYNTEIAASNLRSKADMERYYGKVAMNKAMFQSSETLLGGAMQLSRYAGVGKVPTTLEQQYQKSGTED